MRTATARECAGAESVSDIVHAAVRTDLGAGRDHNEDAVYVDERGRFFVLADGMGGRQGGEVASATAIDVVRRALERAAGELAAFAAAPGADGRERIDALLEHAVSDANVVVLERGRRDPDLRGMGTTLEVVVVVACEAFVAHVGDSRTYLVRDGRARRLTEDHTVAHALRTAGRISDDDELRSPMRSILTNMIGCNDEVVIDHVHVELHAGDRLLMCSDGLYDHFRTPELGVCMAAAAGPEPAVAELVTRARARGGDDNITGIVIEVRRA